MTRSRSCFQTLACELLILVLVCLWDAQPVRACEKLARARADSTCVVMPFNGRKGVWFQLDVADQLRRHDDLVPQLQLQIKNYSDLETHRAAEVGALRGALTAQKAATDKAKAAAELAETEARQAAESAAAAQQELGRWWRTPWVWLSIGALSGALAALAITH